MVGRQCDFRRRGARAHGVAMLEGIGQVQAQRRGGGGSIGNCRSQGSGAGGLAAEIIQTSSIRHGPR